MQKDTAAQKLAEAASLTKKTQLKALLAAATKQKNAPDRPTADVVNTVDHKGSAPLHYAGESSAFAAGFGCCF